MLKHDPQQRSFCRHTVCLCKYLSAGRTETQCRKVNMTKRIRFYNVCQSVLILSLTYMLTFITMWCHFVSLPGAHFIDFVLFICLSVWIHRPTLSLSLSLFFSRSGSFSTSTFTLSHKRCQQTAAQSADATSFDMVKQYCTSSFFLFAHLWRRRH